MLPEHGSIIIFDQCPAGSYASTGEPFAVTIVGNGARKRVHLRNTKTGGETADWGYAYRTASFRELASA